MLIVPFPSIPFSETKDYYLRNLQTSTRLLTNSLANGDFSYWNDDDSFVGPNAESAKKAFSLEGSLFVSLNNRFNNYGEEIGNDALKSLVTNSRKYVDPLHVYLNKVLHVCMSRVRFSGGSNARQIYRMHLQSLNRHPVSVSPQHLLQFPLKYVDVQESTANIFNPSYVEHKSPFTGAIQDFSRGQIRYRGRIVIGQIDKHDIEAKRQINAFFSRIRSKENAFIVPLFQPGTSQVDSYPTDNNPFDHPILANNDGHLPYSDLLKVRSSQLTVTGGQILKLGVSGYNNNNGARFIRNYIDGPVIPSLPLNINGFTLRVGDYVTLNGRLAQIEDRVSQGIEINTAIPIASQNEAYQKNFSFVNNYLYWKEPFAIAKLENENYTNHNSPEFSGPWSIEWREAL